MGGALTGIGDGMDRRCDECGYLALRAKSGVAILGNNPLVEATERFRANGQFDEQVELDSISAVPTCLVRAHDLPFELGAEVDAQIAQGKYMAGDRATYALRWPQPGEILPVISRPRICTRFTPWQAGRSPKEHLEMEERARDRRMVNIQVGISTGIGVLAVVVAAVGIIVGARYNIKAAEIQRDGQATINVSSAPVQPPVINVIVPTPAPEPSATLAPASR